MKGLGNASRQDNALAFFHSATKLFEQATQNMGGYIDFGYIIAGYHIRLRFAGPSLIPALTPAFNHLAVDSDAPPAFTICVWDSFSTGSALPVAPWSWDHFASRGEVRGFNSNRIQCSYQVRGGTLNLLDTEQNVGLFWVRDSNLLPYYETGAPLRMLLHAWMRKHGLQLTHAAAIGTPAGGVLLAGEGGSGKSTSSVACLDSQLAFASDDYCLLSTESTPYAHSLYSSAKLNQASLQLLSRIVPTTQVLNGEKTTLFLSADYSHKLIKAFPIQALLIPRVTGKTATRLRPASPLVGIQALAPSTICQLPGAGREAWLSMMALTKQVPIYHLDLGSDVTQIPQVISAVLKRHSS